MNDVVIIGSGPAGLSAALYILRAGFSVTVIGKDNGALEKAESIQNYFGLERPMSGHELVEIGKKQVRELGGTILQDEVVGIKWDGDYTVSTVNTEISAKAIILTTGASRKRMKIKSLDQFEGYGVSYCAICDAFLYRGREVAVLGNGEYALHEIQELINITGPITLLTNGMEPAADFPPQVNIITTPLAELTGDQYLESIRFQDGTSLKTSCLFVALGTAKGSDLARKLGIRLEDERIVVNEQMDTGLPGVFAAGDCIGGVLQVSVAVGEGAKAALSCIRYLRSL
ncbi:NAD(P)/FAD-dependent oxidoreductase [bacterium]|nr:NAD(P)/FAD-dependent oxidoreductase [bacterium]MCI6431415.1 NAD(P)/FAD-dependent oxidoreductase [Lachnospiraceae bacterium]MDY3021822.1 NAD(P)/FAD-dependent oxidoreductase [Oliverpabstia sp.]MDY5025402.1 NAD(P)/FAD-dependent oxidoreductase [Oliverpabstia sp.]